MHKLCIDKTDIFNGIVIGAQGPIGVEYITKHPGKNNTIQKRGYEIPTDFYFSFGDIPYGFYDIKSRFTDETSKSEKLLEFERDKANRRIWTLNQNIGVIAEYIENIMEELSENSEDVYLYKKYLKEIQDLREKEIIYIIEIRKIEKALANQ